MLTAEPAMETSGLSVVIPVFNEEPVLKVLVERVVRASSAVFGDNFELVLVNDGSSDRSWEIICAHAHADRRIVGINLSRNHGHQLALTAGLNHARGAYVFVLDADLQDPPELLAPMFEKVQAGYDVVFGQRTRRHGETAFKRASASVFYRLLSAMIDTDIPRDTGDFRLMTRRVVDHLNAMPERFRFIRGMVSMVGFSQIALPYERDARLAGETSYPLAKMLAFAADAITSFSVTPLRFASHLGMLFGATGLLAIAWIIWVWMIGGTVQGWASLAALVLIIGSVQLMLLGVFGEYLGRMCMESKRRPLFIISEVRRQSVVEDRAAENPVARMEQKLQDAYRVAR